MSRATVRVMSVAAPLIETGWVSSRDRLARASASPSTLTIAGSTVTVSISNPFAGVPVTIGLTGSCFVWSPLPTEI